MVKIMIEKKKENNEIGAKVGQDKSYIQEQ